VIAKSSVINFTVIDCARREPDRELALREPNATLFSRKPGRMLVFDALRLDRTPSKPLVSKIANLDWKAKFGPRGRIRKAYPDYVRRLDVPVTVAKHV
jgi:hypothetical protein